MFFRFEVVSLLQPIFLLLIVSVIKEYRPMRTLRNYPEFTHFACLPFTEAPQREAILFLQRDIRNILDAHLPKELFTESNHNLAHVTLSMLTLHRQDMRSKFKEAFTTIKQEMGVLLQQTSLTFSQIKYFTRSNPKTKKRQVTLIYLQIQKDAEWKKMVRAGDAFIRAMLKSEVIANNELKQMRISYDHNENLYKNQQYHLTLFRVKEVEEQQFLGVFKEISQLFKPLTFRCRTFDVSTRNHYEESGFYVPFEQVQLSQIA